MDGLQAASVDDRRNSNSVRRGRMLNVKRPAAANSAIANRVCTVIGVNNVSFGPKETIDAK
jgi:hypothetical protein